jgi:hypothetical protein
MNSAPAASRARRTAITVSAIPQRPVFRFDTTDRRDGDVRPPGEILLFEAKQRASGSDLFRLDHGRYISF